MHSTLRILLFPSLDPRSTNDDIRQLGAKLGNKQHVVIDEDNGFGEETYTLRSYYGDIGNARAVLVVNDDGAVIARWVGDSFPSLDEIEVWFRDYQVEKTLEEFYQAKKHQVEQGRLDALEGPPPAVAELAYIQGYEEGLSGPKEKSSVDIPIQGELFPEFVRASGDCVCEDCSHLYCGHPYDPFILDRESRPFLRVLCDGTRVKL